MLNVALPKGRLGDKVYNLLAGVGCGCPEDYNESRKLVVDVALKHQAVVILHVVHQGQIQPQTLPLGLQGGAQGRQLRQGRSHSGVEGDRLRLGQHRLPVSRQRVQAAEGVGPLAGKARFLRGGAQLVEVPGRAAAGAEAGRHPLHRQERPV